MNIIPSSEYNAHPGITKSAICAARVETDVFSMAAENTVRAQDIELNTQRQALAKAELDARWLQDEVDRLRKVARGWGIAWAVAVTCLAVIAAARLIGGAQ